MVEWNMLLERFSKQDEIYFLVKLGTCYRVFDTTAFLGLTWEASCSETATLLYFRVKWLALYILKVICQMLNAKWLLYQQVDCVKDVNSTIL